MNIEEALFGIEEIYGAFGVADAVPAGELRDAEKRLGLRLPVSLETFYRRAGRSGALHGSLGMLVPPVELEVDREHVVFCRADEGAPCWGIEKAWLGLDDPPVDVGYGALGEEPWEREGGSTICFLFMIAVWNGINGELPVSANVSSVVVAGYEPKSTVELARRVSIAADRLGRRFAVSGAASVWIVRGCVLAIEGDFIGLAGRDLSEFLAVNAALGFRENEWDYFSPRDGAPKL
jgi:hypothetical protein